MTLSRAPAEPEVREFETTVERVDGDEVVLSETYFYAESGGQPADRGTIDGVELADVQEVDGEVVHTLASNPAGFAPGDAVVCSVDDAFRTYCTRAHTASHVLYGAARRLFDDLGYAGFDIGTEKIRVDLTTANPIDDGALVELERLSSRAVWDSRPVTWETVPASEARELPDIAFNEKTEEGTMRGDRGGGAGDDRDLVRVVTVDGWDTAACGGTHVPATGEIGPIEVIDRSNPGEGRTRVEFAVGPTGIDRGAAVHGAALEASRIVDAGVEDLPAAVAQLETRAKRLADEVATLEARVVRERLADLAAVERDGTTWAAGTVEGFGPNDLREPLEAFVGEGTADPDVAVVVGDRDAPFVVVASAGEVDAADVVDDLTGAFDGGGGGGPTFAQGGGLDADPEAVLRRVEGR